jgi:hypothetical protein
MTKRIEHLNEVRNSIQDLNKKVSNRDEKLSRTLKFGG